MANPRIITKSGNPLICLDDVILNINYNHSGKSYFKLKSQFKDKRLYRSYIFRRVDFLKELIKLDKIYPGLFYIDFTENQKRNRKLTTVSSEDLNRKVNIQNAYFYPIDQPDVSRINSLAGRKSDSVYNHTENSKDAPASPFNFKFVWKRLKDSTIQLEVKKLKFSKHKHPGEWKQTYFHCIFNQDFTNCIHTDSHNFKFSKKDYGVLQSESGVPKTKGVLTGRNPQAKYDTFAMAKQGVITSYEALNLLTKFISDTRVDYYFEKLIKETK